MSLNAEGMLLQIRLREWVRTLQEYAGILKQFLGLRQLGVESLLPLHHGLNMRYREAVGLNIVTQLALRPYIHFSYTWNYSCYLTEATIHLNSEDRPFKLLRETIGIFCDNNVKHINE
jgi:hypothetical protein